MTILVHTDPAAQLKFVVSYIKTHYSLYYYFVVFDALYAVTTHHRETSCCPKQPAGYPEPQFYRSKTSVCLAEVSALMVHRCIWKCCCDVAVFTGYNTICLQGHSWGCVFRRFLKVSIFKAQPSCKATAEAQH